MFIRTTALVAVLVSLSQVNAHSWADCVDWRFNDPAKPSFAENAGTCHGWARQFPVDAKPFGLLDSFSPSRHYQQDRVSNPLPCSDGKAGVEHGANEQRQNPISKAYGGKFGAQAKAVAGQQMCVRWPAKNHASATEKENFVFINMPQTLLTQDPDQATFLKSTIAKIPYKKCNTIQGDPDKTPCGGCFTVPAGLAAGDYVIQWRWLLNESEYYTSCWDLNVSAAGGNGTDPAPVVPLGTSTTVFAELAE